MNFNKKTIINFVIMAFFFVVFMIIFLLIIYYITPNNYIITLFDETKYTLFKEYISNIKPNTHFCIDYNDYNNRYLKFSIDSPNLEINNTCDIILQIKNFFKSQNLIYNEDEIIFIKYLSQINILNQFDYDINVKISIYEKIK